MRKLSLDFFKTLAITLLLSLLFGFNLAYQTKYNPITSVTVNPPNGVEEGGKVRLSCQLRIPLRW